MKTCRKNLNWIFLNIKYTQLLIKDGVAKKNDELLRLMSNENFDVLFTFDKNLQFQQNFSKYPLAVLILNAEDNTYITLQKLAPKILKLLKTKLPISPIAVTQD